MATNGFPDNDHPNFASEQQKPRRSKTFSTGPDESPPPWMRGPIDELTDVATGTWPPSAVVKEDRRKATVVWTTLMMAFMAYIVYLCIHSWDNRKNPPVQILRKEKPFKLPDIVFCPGQGDGCDDKNGEECLPMHPYLSALEGFDDSCNEYFLTPTTEAPAPSPSSPTTAPAINTPSPMETAVPANDDGVPALGPSPQWPSSYWWPSQGSYGSGGSSSAHYISSSKVSSAAASGTPTPVTPPATPAPVVLPAINISLQTTAQKWCPRVNLSDCSIDEESDVRSLHVSFYVLWNDTVSWDPVLSTRRFVNVFFVDQDDDVTDAVVAVRLPYARVTINGTDPFTFPSNDVSTTTAQHTLRVDTFDGKVYEGALLYVTLSVNNFAYQSVEEVDPVDWWALLGSAGGMWEIICVMFGACFVAKELSKPDKKWGWKKAPNKVVDEEGPQRRRKIGLQQPRSDGGTHWGDSPAVINPIPTTGDRSSA